MNNQMIEKVARELCKLDIRYKRRWVEAEIERLRHGTGTLGRLYNTQSHHPRDPDNG